jgi:hypothetical protein
MTHRRSWTMSLRDRRAMVSQWMAGVSAQFLAVRYDVHPAYVRVAAYRMGFAKRSGGAA